MITCGAEATHADRREILHRVVAELGGGGADREIVGGDQQRAAVGRRVCRVAGADRAAGAAQILDEELSTEMLLKLLRYQARDHVGRPARRIGADDPDLLARIVLRMAAAGNEQRRQQRDKTKSRFVMT